VTALLATPVPLWGVVLAVAVAVLGAYRLGDTEGRATERAARLGRLLQHGSDAELVDVIALCQEQLATRRAARERRSDGRDRFRW
jgi:predicted outer membrane lipoprotein